MIYENKLDGKFVHLRAVETEDAAFVLKIRNNKEVSKFLPFLNVTVEQQQGWINRQRLDSDSYYFIFYDNNGNNIGTISVYNIEDGYAEVGRFCSLGDSVQNIEAALLLNDFVFKVLKIRHLYIWVYKGNKPVLMLNQGFGCKWEGEKEDAVGELFLYGKLTKEDFETKSTRIRKNISTVKKY